MSWEIQLNAPFCTFDVNLCAIVHGEISHGFEIHS